MCDFPLSKYMPGGHDRHFQGSLMLATKVAAEIKSHAYIPLLCIVKAHIRRSNISYIEHAISGLNFNINQMFFEEQQLFFFNYGCII